jgi:anti-anti-sigma factor
MDQRAYVEVRADRDEPVIALIGEFDSASAGELQQQFCNLRAANYRHVVLDFSETRLIDARTLGVMARAYRDGLDITVHGADGIALKALEVAGLATLFHTGVRRGAQSAPLR